MTDNRLYSDFIAKQKRRLLDMKAELERIRDGLEGDEGWWTEEEEDFTQHDSGDRSLSLFNRELDLTIEEQVDRRLKVVERALQKDRGGNLRHLRRYGRADPEREAGGRARGDLHHRGSEPQRETWPTATLTHS